MIDMDAITQFVIERYEPADDWGEEITRNWLGWHANNQSLCVVMENEETICGVGCARTVMKAEDGLDHYAFDPEGSVHFVDLAVTSEPGAFTILFLTMLKRFGRREWIAYQRLPDPEIRIHKLSHLRAKMLQKEFN